MSMHNKISTLYVFLDLRSIFGIQQAMNMPVALTL